MTRAMMALLLAGTTAGLRWAWHYGYLFDATGDKVTEDRDVPLLGVIRIAPMRHRAASIEPLIGGGLTFP